MSEPSAASTPNSSAQLPQKPFWIGGPPKARSRRSGDKGAAKKDGANIPSRSNVGFSKQNSVTLGSIDSATKSSPPVNVLPAKTQSVKQVGSVLAVNRDGKPVPSFGSRRVGPSSLNQSNSTSNHPPSIFVPPNATKLVAPSSSESESSTPKTDVLAPLFTPTPKLFKLDFRTVLQTPPSHPAPLVPTLMVPDSSLLTPALREALNTSITSGRFADTKVYLFSCRNPAGDICKPRALYANSAVLKSVPYFNGLFYGKYSETAMKDLNEDVAEEDVIAKHYDYDSDSDLEDADDLQVMGGPSGVDTTNGPQNATRCFQAPHFSDNHASSYYKERTREGIIIKVDNVAFITFQAFLLYLYTGHIEFAPFGSEDSHKTRATENGSLLPDRIPRPSPKSIYRLADMYDVPTLKSLAFSEIKEGLEGCDPVRETFSKFASYHPEILGMHVGNLVSILTEVDSGEVQDQLDERLQAFAKGKIDHASDAFSSLWKSLIQGGGRNTTRFPLCTRPPPLKEPPPLSIALIKSIREGSFCDRRYLAKREPSKKCRSPVYVSSIVLGGVDRHLNTLIRDWKSSAEGLGDDCDSDSDYEDMTEGIAGSIQEERSHTGQESEPIWAATLSVGTFSTWVTVLFYLYTGHVQFAPLKSNGLEARAEYVRENRQPGYPPLCSPKSVCYLAGKLGLLRLESAALQDVIAKTSVTNIVKETFSRSTARLPRVCEAHCQLLLSSSKDEEITKATEEHIRSLAGGQAPRRFAALSRGFRMAVEVNRATLLGKEDSSEHESLGGTHGTKRKRSEQQRENILGSEQETTPLTRPALQCPNLHCPQRNRPLQGRRADGYNACQSCRCML